MLKRLANHRDPKSWSSKLRRGRFDRLRAMLAKVDGPITIVDVGGTAEFWSRMCGDFVPPWTVIVVNTHQHGPAGPSWVRWVLADARALPFRSNYATLVFSNSVIEHLGSREAQRRMAAEVQRVGVRFLIQTPNKWFPIEPHFLLPGFQFLPVQLRAVMLARHTLGWYRREPSYAAALRTVSDIRLLGGRAMHRLFPDASVERERVFGLTKAWLAIRE